jgi:hypothetical protein
LLEVISWPSVDERYCRPVLSSEVAPKELANKNGNIYWVTVAW